MVGKSIPEAVECPSGGQLVETTDSRQRVVVLKMSNEVVGTGQVKIITGYIGVPKGFKGITFSSRPPVRSEGLKQF